MTNWVLALDASTVVPALALGRIGDDDDALVAVDEVTDRANQASVTLVARIQALVARTGIEMHDLSRLACGRGPGTFTGTRVATATAKGIALGLGADIIPVSTLAAIAGSVERDGPILALLDARRSEVYAGMFSRTGNTLTQASAEACQPLADVVEELKIGEMSPVPIAVGPGVEPYRSALPPAVSELAEPGTGVSAKGLWTAAVSAHRRGASGSPEDLRVTYLRASYAEMGLNTPKRPVKKSPFV